MVERAAGPPSGRILTDMEGGRHDIDAPDFNLDELKQKGLMPQDYELCACGYDHEYDRHAWAAILRAHEGEE